MVNESIYADRVHSLILLNPPYAGIGDRRFAPEGQTQFWYQHFHNLHLFEKLFTGRPEQARIYICHFYEHWSGDVKFISEKNLRCIYTLRKLPGIGHFVPLEDPEAVVEAILSHIALFYQQR
ncbi:hypothetical protein QS257_11680 [Terrilactibacillus sp. S3-3]|nr:hypothetical protein QS257_11680 [Terrilactibacillus sp. S3-3]